MRYLLDTNILILQLSGVLDFAFPPFTVSVSTLTVYELLRYPALSSTEEKRIRKLLDLCERIDVTEAIAERAAQFARSHRKGSIDLLIAATAIELDAILITKNIKDFRGIAGLTAQERP